MSVNGNGNRLSFCIVSVKKSLEWRDLYCVLFISILQIIMSDIFTQCLAKE